MVSTYAKVHKKKKKKWDENAVASTESSGAGHFACFSWLMFL